jgi:pimeloyl-ACP methyl ester carboxylesterase
MPHITAGELQFYYQQTGSGPDVVLIHGVTGNMAIWPMINLIDTLAADFRVTYFDLRGHGYSDTPLSCYTSADMAQDVRNLQIALGLGPLYLLGHSFGAVVAMQTAVLFPDQVAGLILSDAYFPALHDLECDITRWKGWDAYQQRARRSGLEITPEDCFDVGKLCHQVAALDGDKLLKFLSEVGKPGLDRLSRLAATSCGEDIKSIAGLTVERILSVQQPVVALYGEHSPFLATCQFLEKNLPNCKAAIVPGAGHLAHEECPEQYVALVRESLRGLVSSNP